MDSFVRKPISEIPKLVQYKEKLIQHCRNKKKWESSGELYLALREELKNLTNQHCSFCDGYPLGVTSLETIEHYFPKKAFPEKTYDWENLYYCCDICQSNANKMTFEETLRPDDKEYCFDKIFYFDPQTGQINVLENLKNNDKLLFDKANLFLKRYGINNVPQKLQDRKTTYIDAINLLQIESLGDPNSRIYRAVIRTAIEVFNYRKQNHLSHS